MLSLSIRDFTELNDFDFIKGSVRTQLMVFKVFVEVVRSKLLGSLL